jgi:hypothetical protein
MVIIGNRIKSDNLDFVILDDNWGNKFDTITAADAVIIDARNPDFAAYLIRRIRTSPQVELSFKPVFLINYTSTNDPIVSNLNDGILVAYDQLGDAVSMTKSIKGKWTNLQNQSLPTYESQAFKRVLDYMYLRGSRTLKPHIDTRSIIGYTYPELLVSVDREEEFQSLELLEWAEKEGYIWPDFFDRVYLCNNCSSGFLSYREVCPHCDSSNSKSQDLVHHFPCAYVGPISDFQNEFDSALVCPKCNKGLRHIGVDYDKPSTINHCNNCDKDYQDVFIKAKCINCHVDVDVQYLKSKDLNVYKLTKKGRAASTNGLSVSDFEMEEIFGSLSFPMMKTMLHYEIERIRVNPAQQTSIAMIYFENIWELLNKVGKKGEKGLLESIVSATRENIKPTDFIALENNATLYLCLVNSNVTEANTIVTEVNRVIASLIKTNFSDFDIKVSSKAKALETNNNSAFYLKQLSDSVMLV